MGWPMDNGVAYEQWGNEVVLEVACELCNEL